MNKKSISTLALVAILSTTVAACDDKSSETSENKTRIGQRDVYTTLDDCVADWGDTELCQQEMKAAREHAEKMAAAQGHSGSAIPSMIFWGPTYYGDSRSVVHNGVTRTPTTSNATRTANIWNSPSGARTISYAPPPKVVSTPSGVSSGATPTVSRSGFTSSTGAVSTVARGGFGATGASFGGGGG